jgi:hypothetical protein
LNSIELSNFSISDLLATHSEVLNELQRRKVIRSKNNPTGDYAESLVAEKLDLQLAKKSEKGFDAVDSAGLRYQIKGRKVTPDNKSTQLGVIRNLEEKDFDFLIGVIFDENWQVLRAVKIPHAAVSDLASFKKHVNGHIMHLRPNILNNPHVEDISENLRR